MTQGAKCFLNIRWLLLRSVLHSRPNLPNTITSISPEGPPSPFIVEKHPLAEGAPHEVKRFWRFPIITSEFCATAIQETEEWARAGGGRKQNGKWWKESRRRQITAQRRSCCWIPHKNYSRRNGTWPGGNQHCPQPDYSWHNPDTVLFDVPHPSVLYVVFYLTLK